jgi:hypothetical protein
MNLQSKFVDQICFLLTEVKQRLSFDGHEIILLTKVKQSICLSLGSSFDDHEIILLTEVKQSICLSLLNVNIDVEELSHRLLILVMKDT